MSDRVSMCTSI